MALREAYKAAAPVAFLPKYGTFHWGRGVGGISAIPYRGQAHKAMRTIVFCIKK